MNRIMSDIKKQILFTPGPLMTTDTVKRAMFKDFASRDIRFMEAVKSIRKKMITIAQLDPNKWTCILQQGAGTMAIEAAISTTVPKLSPKYLLLNSGKYAERQGQIVKRLGFPMISLKSEEGKEIDFNALNELLKSNSDVTTVGYVHHETSTGMIYPAEDIGRIVRQHIPNAVIIMDAMSSFGAIPVNVEKACDILITSANKCFHGVPGFAIILARKELIKSCKGQSRSSCLDLYAQYLSFEKTNQFIITPPVHTIMAFYQALIEYEEEGGIKGRSKSYELKSRIVLEEAKKLGFTLFLNEKKPSFGHIVVCLNMPSDPRWNFKKFYLFLNQRGFILYPGKASHAETFRIGIIGSTSCKDMKELMNCAREALLSMGIERLGSKSNL
ncbi:2-aminoethylphosphonate:pyruvateaminotransferas e-like protein [Trypanosoma theileri]|uniref:2-aminoethylphosphonate:pyruvateaminotransferas e-like protein n=1 Tax=Trypanosoma theileri TaxID=67003 RepID=A0A1X0P8N5_9TRYP|nr:2-aminoethylphosphonate:pyruvateaminotransferas e-like protein [Trypanosoma theileri]ORC93296.1 2-aminoethylphosphonate:pyruvateaminotransferas e-like protein [Trypanosoma theileri]